MSNTIRTVITVTTGESTYIMEPTFEEICAQEELAMRGRIRDLREQLFEAEKALIVRLERKA